ncbi:Lrp/AsnC family transcriptional regulator [Allosediminivita pacifica]|uniref:AsnC family transcriptional regulator n=1 Tax=Allosediminivita pacifica TaxID=1267769 RepID=A0A2T6AX49_9RHOB|nr:Lrp/AsnC family transcriptional regulator [Allosediminivita pacifica]PTX48368.1 AsnC family transcriptional regulator [Allosediminivita pacifica]GGB11011.1 transcriptional regulator [Allosediminivita pacifica]
MTGKIDQIDIQLLKALQRHGSGLTQRELAEVVGLSQNACWRRLNALEKSGVIEGRTVRINRRALGKNLVVFTMLRTRSHSREWLDTFRQHVTAIPEIVDFYRIGGDYDYMLKIVTDDIESFDGVYQRLIDKVELDSVTSYIAMESILENRPIAL